MAVRLAGKSAPTTHRKRGCGLPCKSPSVLEHSSQSTRSWPRQAIPWCRFSLSGAAYTSQSCSACLPTAVTRRCSKPRRAAVMAAAAGAGEATGTATSRSAPRGNAIRTGGNGVDDSLLSLRGSAMPLLDHFHPPLQGRRHWEGFHGWWAAAIAGRLNEHLLPPEYVAAI